MKIKKYTFCLTLIVFSISVFANNSLLERAFWKEKPSIETIKSKVKEGNDPTQLNKFGFDPIVYAVLENTDIDIIKHLLTYEGNGVNKLTHDGRTYIFWAAYKGNITLMKHLLKNGAKTDLIDDKGYTVLNFAASTGQQNTEVFEMCIENGADLKNDLDKHGANALLLAAPFDNEFKIINYFKSKGLSINSIDNSKNGIFNYAARNGNISILKKLYNEGIKGDNEAILYASMGSRGVTNGIEVFKYLESTGLTINTISKNGNNNPLHYLTNKSKDIELLNYFISKGVDINLPNKDGNTPFMYAASNGNLEIVKTYYKTLKSINQTNNLGETALTYAVKNNSSEIVKFLIENKADINILDKENNSLTYYLILSYSKKEETNFNDKVSLLKAQNFKLNTLQNKENTLLHVAILKNSTELAKQVLAWGSNINQKNKDGETPLHIAAMKAKDTELLKFLIQNGADKKVTTSFGETAYMLAKENEVLIENNIDISFLNI